MITTDYPTDLVISSIPLDDIEPAPDNPLGLEALRKVERYGIVQSDEQYRGWQALPPGTPMPTAKMTVDAALEVLRIAADWTCGPDYDDPHAIRQAYRHGARHLHPDAGGDPEQFRRLVEARDLALGAAA